MHTACSFALDFAEAALDDALRAIRGLPSDSVAAAAAARAQDAVNRVREAVPALETLASAGGGDALEEAIDHLMSLVDDVSRAADGAMRRAALRTRS